MRIERRQVLTGMAGAPGAAALGGPRSEARSADVPERPFPRKADFAFAKGVSYINGAFTHPMPTAAADAYRAAVARRATVGGVFEHTA